MELPPQLPAYLWRWGHPLLQRQFVRTWSIMPSERGYQSVFLTQSKHFKSMMICAFLVKNGFRPFLRKLMLPTFIKKGRRPIRHVLSECVENFDSCLHSL